MPLRAPTNMVPRIEITDAWRNNKTKNQADDQSTDDTFDQADVVPLFN